MDYQKAVQKIISTKNQKDNFRRLNARINRAIIKTPGMKQLHNYLRRIVLTPLGNKLLSKINRSKNPIETAMKIPIVENINSTEREIWKKSIKEVQKKINKRRDPNRPIVKAIEPFKVLHPKLSIN